MLAHILTPAREIISHPADDLIHKNKLFFRVEFRMEKGVVHLRTRGDFPEQSALFLPERGKDRVNLCDREALLEIVEQRIIDVLIRLEMFRILTAQLNQARQPWLENREICFFARFRPCVMRFCRGSGDP